MPPLTHSMFSFVLLHVLLRSTYQIPLERIRRRVYDICPGLDSESIDHVDHANTKFESEKDSGLGPGRGDPKLDGSDSETPVEQSHDELVRGPECNVYEAPKAQQAWISLQ